VALNHNAVFHASISFFSEPNRIYSVQYFKRFEERNCPAKRKINIAKGYYRHWMLRSVVIAADHCYFYGCGDIDRIAQLLRSLVALGDNTRIGWGTIHSWHIEPTSDDYSLIKDGKAQRPIPVRLLESYNDAVELAWKPPYWAADSIELCAPPGTEVKLK
jgi:CRISPR type IV-associated protein Csf3